MFSAQHSHPVTNEFCTSHFRIPFSEFLLPCKDGEVTKAQRTLARKVSSLSPSMQAQNPFVKSYVPFKWELFWGVIFCSE